MIALLIQLSALAALAQSETDMNAQKDKTPADLAERYVRSFQEGKDFMPPSTGLSQQSEPDTEALRVLDHHLLEEGADVRENIVDLLADIGTQCADPAGNGASSIKNKRVIELLSGAGLAKADVAREQAMRYLRKLVLRADLAAQSSAYAQALEMKPTNEAFLLVAKAGALEARDVVNKLAERDDWRNEQAALVAKASLGDAAVNARYLEALEVAKTAGDAFDFGNAIQVLSLIATPQAVKVVAENMRTPLVHDVPMVIGRSMRLAVLEGLMYNYPDRIELYPGSIIAEADYTRAENFCEQELGAVFNSPKPPFMTYKGYPAPVPVSK
ncbi:MAG: hypothetical protein KA791_16220 [Flavobacteriales bacterium]|nr:hypothetical protein [Flavobacteriales bacterium]